MSVLKRFWNWFKATMANLLKSFWAWYAATFKKAKFWGKIVILFLSFTFIVCLISVPAAIFDKSTPTPEPTVSTPIAPSPTETQTSILPTLPVVASRCVPASAAQITALQDGVDDTGAANYIKTAWAVKSNDFNNVWMVAAIIYGPNMELGVGPAAWAMSGDFDSPGITMSVDEFAKQYSPWPDASATDAHITQIADGVQEAITCALMEIGGTLPTQEVVSTLPSSTQEIATRCVKASEAQLGIIQDGIKDVDNNNYVMSAWAVKSNDFNNVWMVAALIYGSGMEDGVGPGVWAISGDFESPGLILSVNGFAKEFSLYQDASQTDAQIMGYEDGVEDAIECAKMNK